MAGTINVRPADLWRVGGAIALRVVGNFVYDAINGDWFDTEYLGATILYVITCIAATLLMINVLRSVSRYDDVIASEHPFGESSVWRFLNTLVGSILLGALTASVVAIVATLPLLPSRTLQPVPIVPPFSNYEVGVIGAFTVLSILVTRRQVDWIALAGFAISYSLVASSVLKLIEPDQQSLAMTLPSYALICILLVVVSLLAQSRILRLFRELTRQR